MIDDRGARAELNADNGQQEGMRAEISACRTRRCLSVRADGTDHGTCDRSDISSEGMPL
jgi:hypothetical protein